MICVKGKGKNRRFFPFPFTQIMYHRISGECMEVESNSSLSERRQELKNKYLTRLQPAIKHSGLSHLKIDDIVRFMGISKATFYKYFSSKEDVIEQGTELVASYFKQAATLISNESSSHLQRFQNAFTQSLVLAVSFPDTFLLDLKQTYPLLWERVKQAKQERRVGKECRS